MKTRAILISGILVVVVSTGLGVAGALWYVQRHGGTTLSHEKPQPDTRSFKYISMDKVVVMLRNAAGEPAEHYLALDLVFRTPAENEAVTREQLPLLRSVAVQSLSA